ncbi:type II toxin-antitoxin system death-on-curing family toxin [Magnetofaba australis]|uniref:Putative death on curing protein n=1 Tax=Magnetofaba australis IT-1 TaxID=1434232 RepID=A0A1Y2KAA9_9PROT|nr:type II toxin-antitoxin system death-on-curing family toxin [Magnetofaba australis]OSM07658.1 putative death on curing protein [Magnetofaba australis IT-1]
MADPVWLLKKTVLAIHQRQLAEHGGPEGLRDEGLLDSALARPHNLMAYSDTPPTLARLAAAYAFGIARNHPFVDGNKRVAYVTCLLFLRLNGLTLQASAADKYQTFMRLADGNLSEEEFAQWLESSLSPLT